MKIKITANNNIKETLKKLQTLAERGIGGEAVNAKQLLDRLLIKHNLSIDELKGEELVIRTSKIPKMKLKLYIQIVAHVNHNIRLGEIPNRHRQASGDNIVIECTNTEYLIIEQMFEHYSLLFDKEYEVFYTAFICSNSLFTSAPPITINELSDVEREERLRAEKMAKTIKSESFNKRITS